VNNGTRRKAADAYYNIMIYYNININYKYIYTPRPPTAYIVVVVEIHARRTSERARLNETARRQKDREAYYFNSRIYYNMIWTGAASYKGPL